MLSITNHRDPGLGLNLHHSDFNFSALFYIMLLPLALNVVLFFELHPVGIWNLLWYQKTIDSRKVRSPWGREGRGAKVSSVTPGGKYKCQLFNWPRIKEALLEITLLLRTGSMANLRSLLIPQRKQQWLGFRSSHSVYA